MASGSSGRGSKYDFAADDILCSYEDYGTQDANNGAHSDPSVAANSAKEFHKSRTARASVLPATTYSPPEESSFHQGVITTVESTVKKYTDNVMRFLEGISSRLSQLELYCYNLDKSIGEMRADLVRDHEESESKLKSLEKHVQEVHRSVQILRDKQELADTQKELAKLQLAQKESTSANNTQQNEDRASTPATEAKKSDNSSDVHDQQLALVPHQATQPSLPARPIEHQQAPMAPPSSMPPQSMPPSHAYYVSPPQASNITAQSQPSQAQYLPIMSQVQDPSRLVAPPPPLSQVSQGPHVQSVPPYPQQWPQQQLQLPSQQPQQPVMPPQIRNPSQVVYANYVPQSNQSPAEMAPNSMPMQAPYVGASQAGSAGPELPNPYGFGPAGRPIQPQPLTQHSKTGYGAQPGDGYVPSGPRPTLLPGNAYVMYDGEGGRTQTPPQPHFQQSAYPPSSFHLQNPQRAPGSNMVAPHPGRSHPYSELMEKMVGMGYRGENVIGVIQRLEESGQPIDFNSVLDRLNGQAAAGPQRGWSG